MSHNSLNTLPPHGKLQASMIKVKHFLETFLVLTQTGQVTQYGTAHSVTYF
ncbi:MAG: hypothetical protein Ta2A_19790 [Treponemataceae bacterium]|nr:MAG: hypothetical protein Ta2A_19790 [Treponemataceae bacterium]